MPWSSARSPRKSTPRQRIQKIRRNILAYSVPRQGVRHRRTPAQAAEEWRGAQAAMAYYNAQKQARRRAPVHARPLKKKKSLWTWLWRR